MQTKVHVRIDDRTPISFRHGLGAPQMFWRNTFFTFFGMKIGLWLNLVKFLKNRSDRDNTTISATGELLYHHHHHKFVYCWYTKVVIQKLIKTNIQKPKTNLTT